MYWHSQLLVTLLTVVAFVALQAEDDELKSLQISLADTQPVGALVKCCKTVDQVSGWTCSRCSAKSGWWIPRKGNNWSTFSFMPISSLSSLLYCLLQLPISYHCQACYTLHCNYIIVAVGRVILCDSWILPVSFLLLLSSIDYSRIDNSRLFLFIARPKLC